jgi:hypothetical protein
MEEVGKDEGNIYRLERLTAHLIIFFIQRSSPPLSPLSFYERLGVYGHSKRVLTGLQKFEIIEAPTFNSVS